MIAYLIVFMCCVHSAGYVIGTPFGLNYPLKLNKRLINSCGFGEVNNAFAIPTLLMPHKKDADLS